ncbi:hypothetical protein QWJ41_20475 [Nocardioides sp. SOB44]|uniref:Uncharacterized protein n=1 Tax=Nocardioides cremeus TaxID=3058044 RepID=A0ABT8TVW9_9ACTN|nr:hypothetical protein [Nocardioides cremeus]MDO3398108.1 hypothetical protein [Nocardioides cremeus]
MSWTYQVDRVDQDADDSGLYSVVSDSASIAGPADVTFVALSIAPVDRAWIRDNCDQAYLSIGIGSSDAIYWEWESGKRPNGYTPRGVIDREGSGNIVITQGRQQYFRAYVHCSAVTADGSGFVGRELPEMNIRGVAAVDYLDPSSVREVN